MSKLKQVAEQVASEGIQLYAATKTDDRAVVVSVCRWDDEEIGEQDKGEHPVTFQYESQFYTDLGVTGEGEDDYAIKICDIENILKKININPEDLVFSDKYQSCEYEETLAMLGVDLG